MVTAETDYLIRLNSWLAKERLPDKLHYAVLVVTSGVVLSFYYMFRSAIPISSDYWMDWFWGIFYFEFCHYALGLMLNIPIMYAAFTLERKRSLLIILALVVAITPYIMGFSFHANVMFLSLAILIFPALVVVGIRMALESHAREKAAKAERERLRLMSLRQKYRGQEEERKRMAQELHDGVIQTSLINASIVRDLVQNHARKPSDVVEKDLALVESNSLNIASDIRNICRNLRPSILDNLGLVPAIRWLADHLHEESGIKVNLSVKNSADGLSPDEDVALFRLVQEALNNIRLHAEATRADVSVDFRDSGVAVEIKDDGRGFRLPENVNSLALFGKLGVIGMYERAQSVGAVLEIDSVVGSGTTIRISLDKSAAG